ncbi:MAG: hypothetical protein JWQ50_7091 [Caballeronia mineralivorans]|jgi:hypothetical protein|nr:hypothetical protein [Caballeronia mineralivorans]MEA3097681.1 hypothetical protein [Caballeronia mineralivorans]
MSRTGTSQDLAGSHGCWEPVFGASSHLIGAFAASAISVARPHIISIICCGVLRVCYVASIGPPNTRF